MAIDPKRYVSFADGAALCGPGGSIDTIERRHKAGLLPTACPRPGCAKGTWEVQLGDLVDQGPLDPSTLPDEPNLDILLPRSRAERDLQAVRLELQAATLALQAAERELARADREASHCRRIAEKLSKSGGHR